MIRRLRDLLGGDHPSPALQALREAVDGTRDSGRSVPYGNPEALQRQFIAESDLVAHYRSLFVQSFSGLLLDEDRNVFESALRGRMIKLREELVQYLASLHPGTDPVLLTMYAALDEVLKS
jgi:hypothetical protein